MRKLEEEALEAMEISGDDHVHGKQEKKKDSVCNLTEVIAQLEEAIYEAHLRNDVDDTFENKVEQDRLLLRLQTVYENGKIQANLLVGRYTAIMKEHLQRIVDLAEQKEKLEENVNLRKQAHGVNYVEGLAEFFQS